MTITKLIEKANSDLYLNISLANFCNEWIKNGCLAFGYRCGAFSEFRGVGNCETAIREYIRELYLDAIQTYTLYVQESDNSITVIEVNSIAEGEKIAMELYDKIAYQINPNF